MPNIKAKLLAHRKVRNEVGHIKRERARNKTKAFITRSRKAAKKVRQKHEILLG
jgi:hypothetical protein